MRYLAIPLFFLSLPAMGQSPGYMIVTSSVAKDGATFCAPSCTSDSDCFEDLCTEEFLNGPGQAATKFCGGLRFAHLDLSEHTQCSSSHCRNNDVCLQAPGLQQLENFAQHKRNRGFAVHIFTPDAWGGGQGQAAAENLRNWLINTAPALSAEYLLIIGDPSPDIGPMPMKKTHPEHNAQQSWATPGWAVPTDYYYADLHGNWDLDGDGFFGEFGDISEPEATRGDFGPGGIDRIYDLKVGRIPWYQQANTQEVDHILAKTILYQNADTSSIAWRRSALIATEGENRFFFGEGVRNDVLIPNNFSSYRVYDAACIERGMNNGDPCLSPIQGQPDALECTPPNVVHGWNNFHPGLVMWLTHGSGSGAASVMSSGLATTLNDDKPAFTFQASCYNSQPEATNNVSFALLKNGAISTVGATRISHGPGGPMVLQNTATNAGMGYEYSRRMIALNENSGTAFFELKQSISLQNRWWYWKNLCAFNIYGDPQVGLQDSYIEPPPSPIDAGFVPPANDASLMDALVLDVGRRIDDAGTMNPDAVNLRGPDATRRMLLDAEVSKSNCSCKNVALLGHGSPSIVIFGLLLLLFFLRRRLMRIRSKPLKFAQNRP
jgi:hypothetical protein